MNELKKELLEFYKHHLNYMILPFWLKRSTDHEYGGYFTCFDNFGRNLVGTDKYSWTHGRMVWIYSQLSAMIVFSKKERENFLHLAQAGAEFLMKHCLLDNGHCVFQMDRSGKAVFPEGHDIYDISIYADCFVVLGLARYSVASGSKKAYMFARSLYLSVLECIDNNRFKSEPYPVPEGYRSHGISAILLNVSMEMALAMREFIDVELERTEARADAIVQDVMKNFACGSLHVREMILCNNKKDNDSILGRYINPGHTIECMWFVIHQAHKKADLATVQKAAEIIKNTFEVGWDKEYGGLQLFADCEGGQPKGNILGMEDVKMVHKIVNDWDCKLWWPHSEALYASLLAGEITGDAEFFKIYWKIHTYTFKTFPNPDCDIGEWIQIRDRRGRPQEKIVALPVKDPFHVIRNILLVINLLSN